MVGKVLLTDITYLTYGASNSVYLSTIKDASTNKILSYNLSESLTLDKATEAVKKLMRNHKKLLDKDGFIHSHQGVHYTIPRVQKLLKKYKIGQSMSRRGNCWATPRRNHFFCI